MKYSRSAIFSSPLGVISLYLLVALPELGGRGKRIEREFPLDHGAKAAEVVVQESVAVGAERERYVEEPRRSPSPVGGRPRHEWLVLGLDDGYRDVGLTVQDYVRALSLAADDLLSLDEDSAVGQEHFLADLSPDSSRLSEWPA